MNSQLTAYVSLICTSGVLNLYLCTYVYRNRYRYKHIAHFFVFYTASIAIYCFASALGLLSTTLAQIKFWTVIQYVGMPISTPFSMGIAENVHNTMETVDQLLNKADKALYSAKQAGRNQVHIYMEEEVKVS